MSIIHHSFKSTVKCGQTAFAIQAFDHTKYHWVLITRAKLARIPRWSRVIESGHLQMSNLVDCDQNRVVAEGLAGFPVHAELADLCNCTRLVLITCTPSESHAQGLVVYLAVNAIVQVPAGQVKTNVPSSRVPLGIYQIPLVVLAKADQQGIRIAVVLLQVVGFRFENVQTTQGQVDLHSECWMSVEENI